MNTLHNKIPESGSKKFWRIVLGTIVGVMISSILLSIISFFFMIGIIASISSLDKTKPIPNNSILKISLTAPIPERTIDNPFSDYNFGDFSQNNMGLQNILKTIRAASTDPKISGIWLNLSQIPAHSATIEEIRNELLNFKESGKFIYAYSEVYSQSAYYLATVADKIFLNPKGELEFKGIAMQVMFYKGLLEKLNVEMQIIRHGEYKSAVEPFMLDKMSQANREQMDKLCNSLWETVTNNISKARSIPVDSLNYYANLLLPSSPADAVTKRFIDSLTYYSEFENFLRAEIACNEDDELNFVSLKEYEKAIKTSTPKASDKIAVIYAVGNIIDGKGDEEIIGSETLCKDIKAAYSDKDVKAIVLRINSPGGSALASEVIWHEIELAKKAGKIVVTSMGDYAASGGYYIACNSDFIVAEPNTLTGSIGVFGMIPNFQQFLEKKLGITVDMVKSNKHSDYISGLRKLDDVESKKLLALIEETYATFTQRVADGRKMDIARVDEIGQGRVWTGKDAKELGLVDQMGNMNDAIQIAAKLTDISSYEIDYYPVQKSWFEKILDQKNDVALKELKGQLGVYYDNFLDIKRLSEMQGVQARLPMTIIID